MTEINWDKTVLKLSKIEAKYDQIWDDILDKDGKPTGNKKLNHLNLATNIIQKYRCITFGEERQKIYYYEDGYYKKGGKAKIKRCCQNATEGCLKSYDVTEVTNHIIRLTIKDKKLLTTPNEGMLNIKNGILNLKTKELTLHTPKTIFINQLPHEFNPEAKCPNILNFIKQVVPQEDIKVIQEWAGYSLYNEYFIKKACILLGDKNTGKTTLINLLVHFVGEENTSSLSLHSITKDKFAKADMLHKLVNFYDDLNSNDITETGTFKVACGHGYLSAEQKFGETFSFKNYAKLLFATNKIPPIKDADDDAYYDRWLVILFNNVFDKNKADPHILKKLTTKEEMSGFLNWALEGLERILKKGYFSYSRDAEQNKQVMEKSSSPVASFIQDVLFDAHGAWISKETLYNIYCEYCKEYDVSKVAKEKFGREINRRAKFIVESRKDTPKKKSEHGWLNVGFQINTRNTAFEKIILKIFNLEIIKENNKEICYFFNFKQEYNKRGITSISLKTKDSFDEKSIIHRQKCDAPDCWENECNENDVGNFFCRKHFPGVDEEKVID